MEVKLILLFSKSNILLYYIAIYGNGSEVCKSIKPSTILSGDDSLNNYTNYNIRLKFLQPEIYPVRYM